MARSIEPTSQNKGARRNLFSLKANRRSGLITQVSTLCFAFVHEFNFSRETFHEEEIEAKCRTQLIFVQPCNKRREKYFSPSFSSKLLGKSSHPAWATSLSPRPAAAREDYWGLAGPSRALRSTLCAVAHGPKTVGASQKWDPFCKGFWFRETSWRH